MRYAVTREEMQNIDAYSIKTIGIPGLVLMEKAALSMEHVITERYSKDKHILIVTELGNNGGDGLALGRLLRAKGYHADIYEIGGIKKASDSYQVQRHILEQLGIPVYKEFPEKDYDIYVDAIFGVGLKRAVTGIQADVIQRINNKEGIKIAVDVPSGVDASDGKILGTAFKADMTITFGLQKIGLLLYPGASCSGEVLVEDIGFPDISVETIGPKVVYYGDEDLVKLPERRPDSHKGTYGRVLLIAGSKNMAGAALLAARAAYRTGSGLIRIFTCEANRVILQSQVPEAIMTTYETEQEALELLPEALSWASVIGIGPGLGKSPEARAILDQTIREGKAPLVIDADGINLLAENPALYEALKRYPANVILTPHLMEMSRITGYKISEIKERLIDIAQNYARDNLIIALKDARTIVAGGNLPVYINVSGNHGMSVGGSGDVLTGIICGLLAGGLDSGQAARLGVYIHGRAGDAAAEEKGYYGLLAGDIALSLYHVIH